MEPVESESPLWVTANSIAPARRCLGGQGRVDTLSRMMLPEPWQA